MNRKVKGLLTYVKQVFSEFAEDNILKYSASLAYYTVFSLAPMIIIIISVFGVLFGREAIQGQIYSQIKGLVGSDAALQIQNTIKASSLAGHSFFASTISIIVLLIGATSIFGEIQDSLNKIWGLKTKPRKSWLKMILNRLLSFSLIISLGFIMMVSLMLNALVTWVSGFMTHYFSGPGATIIALVNDGLSFCITIVLFALIFKVLPDAKIKWKDVFVGALITSIFFMIGKLGIGFYLGKSNLATIYGAAGSIIIIMLWVYYSSIILYLGAEFTKVYAKQYGGKIFPSDYAVWIKTEEKEVANPALKNKVLE